MSAHSSRFSSLALFGLVALTLVSCDDTSSDQCGDPPTEVSCCEGDHEVEHICQDGEWVCPDGSQEMNVCPDVPVDMADADMTGNDMDAGDTSQCTGEAPSGLVCCQGDVEANHVCINGDWDCDPGFVEVPIGDCGLDPDMSDLDDADTSDPCASCQAPQWCDYPDNQCGQGDQAICEGPPIDCLGADDHQVCGCDGMVYDNGCVASGSGVDVDIDNACTAPLDTFKCGEKFCAANTEICRIIVSDVPSIPDGYECEDLAAGCNGVPTCDCYMDDPCGGQFCMLDGSDLFLTCPGG